jgi:membrane protease YdiL (CAAX protease family)
VGSLQAAARLDNGGIILQALRKVKLRPKGGTIRVSLPSRPRRLAALTKGAIWGFWHYPAAMAGSIPYEHGLVSLLLIPWYMIAFSIILGWLRLRTGSIWAPSLAHAGARYIFPGLSAALFVSPPRCGDWVGRRGAMWTFNLVFPELQDMDSPELMVETHPPAVAAR